MAQKSPGSKQWHRRAKAIPKIAAALVDPLETRRLLTYTLSATAAADLIEITPGAANFTVDIFVNNTLAGTTGDNDVRISGLGGDDQFVMRKMPGHSSSIFDIKMIGGPGDDRYDLGEGKFTPVFFFGIVRLEEIAGEGNDRLFVDASGSDPVALPGIKGDRIGDIAFFDEHIELKQINYGHNDDNIVVDSVPAGLRLDLNGGNDTVTYGGAGKKINVNVAAGAVDGGLGTDKVVFDDSNGDGNVNRDYPISTTRIMNQAMTGVEQGEVKVRQNITGTRNSVIMTGGGNVDTLKLAGSALIANDTGPRLLIGTQESPVDLDGLPLQLNAEWQSSPQIQYEIWSQDANFTTNPTVLDGVNGRQLVQAGFFSAWLNNGGGGISLKVNGGLSADVYHIRDVLPNSQITVTGGGGDDVLLTLPDAGHNNAPQSVFVGAGFRFDGGGGNDILFLDDSLAPIGDGVASHDLFNSFAKRGQTYLTYSSVDDVHFTADGGHNTIHFNTGLSQQTALETRYVIDAGAGNDVISNYVPSANGGALSAITDVTILGGAGNDIFAVDDTLAGSRAHHYTIGQSAISYSGLGFVGGRFLFDDAVEQVELNEGSFGAETSFDAKRPTAKFIATLGGGDDTITVGGGDIDASGITSATATLFGGTGNDTIIFDDSNDDHGVSDGDVLTVGFNTVTKDGTTIVYAGFESQRLITSGVNSSSFLFPNTIRLHGIDMPTEVVGPAGDRDNVVEVGHPTFGISQVTFGTITLNFAAAPAIVNVNDVSTVGRTYRLTPTQLFLPSIVNYSGVAGLNIYAGGGPDTFNVDALSPNTNVFFAGGAGDDLMSIGSGGPIAPIAGRVFVRGNDGNDEFFITNGAGGGFTDATLVAGTISFNGGPAHLYDTTVERMHVIANDAGGDFDVRSSIVPTTLHGAAGNDHVTVGAGNINTTLTADLHVEGNGGHDSVVIDDTAAPNVGFISAGYSFDVDGTTERMIRSADTVSGPNRIFSFTGVEQRTLHCNAGDSGVAVYNTLSDLRINTNGGNDGIFIHDGDVPVTLNTGTGMDYLQVGNYFGTDTPIVVFDQDDEVSGMSIRHTGQVRLLNHAVLSDLGTLRGSLGEPVVSGVLDVGNGALLMGTGQYALTAEQIRGLLTRGRNGGAWNGVNFQGLGTIHSTAAAASSASDGVGYGMGTQVAIGSFAINPGDTLIRHTLEGDGDLSGSVDIGDFARLAANFNRPTQNWAAGDYNYDGSTDIADFSALASNFNQSPARAPLMPFAGIRTPSSVRFGDSLIDWIEG